MTAPRKSPLSDRALPALVISVLFDFWGGLRPLDRCKEKLLLPLRRPAPPNPRMGSGNRTSKDSGKACGTQSKAIVPSHGRRITSKEKYAIRKSPLAKRYAMRILSPP